MNSSICHETPPLESIDNPGESEKEQGWLREELGLYFDPFHHLDAGADPRLPTYLIDHGAFPDLWGDWPSFLFAPAGGGKTAFRVRLARACRVEQDGRRVFPIIFLPPRPEAEDKGPEEHFYFEQLLQAVASALLLQLTYRPDRFLELSAPVRETVRSILEQDFPGSLDYYLDQLEEAGCLAPLARAFDRTAVGLPAEPSAERIREFCAAVRGTPFKRSGPSEPRERLQWVIRRLTQDLGYESVYLLVDGVDAYVQNPPFAVRLIHPLLDRLRAWEKQAFFVKFFLPEELEPLLRERYQTLLTPPSRVIIIEWDESLLARLLQERLYVSSKGMYDSLEAISTRESGGYIEERLVRTVRPRLPREVLRLARRVFDEHLHRIGPYGRLESRDFAAAQNWYESQKGANRQPARTRLS